ncbi:ester cyclase [Candidatus Phyllobacterium onerii]|uniref:ester cyclase n=1 Tax=Candidatus Phyllobacterium onerii TaxID=3020828 RepID=UPI00232DDBD9|nr:ester cyclase [Phyllobacterium sp. IY22]
MPAGKLLNVYENYIECLNRQDWPQLGVYVSDDVHYNGTRIGLSGYREMLERDFHEIPDLHFTIALLIAEPPRMASRLDFHCTPKGAFLGLPVNRKKVRFAENVFYDFGSGKIDHVWSVIDKLAVEEQLSKSHVPRV